MDNVTRFLNMKHILIAALCFLALNTKAQDTSSITIDTSMHVCTFIAAKVLPFALPTGLGMADTVTHVAFLSVTDNLQDPPTVQFMLVDAKQKKNCYVGSYTLTETQNAIWGSTAKEALLFVSRKYGFIFTNY
jgi:hypothetical protein